MAFTDDQLAYLRTKLGSTVNDGTDPDVVDDLEDRFLRLGSVQLVAVEVLRQRLADIADLQNNPLNFTVTGEYSQDSSANVAFLQRMLNDAEQEAGVPGSSTMTAVQPGRSRWSRHPRHGRRSWGR
jgi:hypothetical protein